MTAFQFLPFEPAPDVGHLLRQSFFARGHIGYRTEKILPTGQIALLFTLGHPHRLGKSSTPASNPAFAEAWVDGFQTTPTWHTPEDGTHVLGLLFEPPGFHALFGTDMAATADRTHDARTLLPDDFIAFIKRQLARADDPATHARIGEHLAGRQLEPLPDWLFPMYQQVREHRGDIDLDAWYASTGHSDRHVSKVFKRAVGVTPKVLCRIHRLLALLEAVDPSTDVNWTTLAHDFGFYDQPHFNREFRKLSGLYPSEYLDQRRREYAELAKGEHVVFAPQD